VDVLVLDETPVEVWTPWVIRCPEKKRPSAIVWSGPLDSIIDETGGPIHKSFRKTMKRAGYTMEFWSMNAEAHGAALAQDRLIVTCTLRQGTNGFKEPAGDDVPPRSMSNLLMPTGVPHKAWFQGQTYRASKSAKWWPCEVRRLTRKQEPVFDHHGRMPDLTGCWVQSKRGVRRLQAQELAKAKGIPNDWLKAGCPLKDAVVRGCTGIHIWTAALDSILEWINLEKPQQGRTQAPT
jgi:site-specific DNA-cytosine methylase